MEVSEDATVEQSHGMIGEPARLGDFTSTWRMVPITGLALLIGFLAAGVAFALLRLIGLFTNLFFFQRWSFALVTPAENKLGWLQVLVPVAGALVIGLMARYGSERIRGHGIPEALEAILIRGSRVQPRVAFLKPLSSAISIGSGGPFGAEGPIIMTGGAFGSLVAQLFHLTSSERKILLVAGAAAGMSATFAAPLASVLLAVELLLFELKPRSLVPFALASAAAAVVRHYILGDGPLFPTATHVQFLGAGMLASAVLVGLLAGALSALLTTAVYASEDLFQRLPIHWMWWPALGGLVIGLGGLACPQALGVGYDIIGGLLQHEDPARLLCLLLFVKATIWAVSLGSGTSGGVLAPLLMMGGTLGGLLGPLLPGGRPGFWPLIAMGAILGGTMRSPLTAVVFSLELTHDYGALLPLVIAVSCAHAFTVLVMRRSILTEKVARRGFHVTREYAIDPLEVLLVREVMRTDSAALPAGLTASELAQRINGTQLRGQNLLPVLDSNQDLVGVITRTELAGWIETGPGNDNGAPLADRVRRNFVSAFPDETLRTVVYRMAATGRTRLLVVDRANPKRLLGTISLRDLLKARTRHLEEEQRRERVLPLRAVLPTWFRGPLSLLRPGD